MKTRAILILGLTILIGTPTVSAQSFKDKFKNAAKKIEKKIEKKVENKAEQKVKQPFKQTISPQKDSSKSNKTLGNNKGISNDKAADALFGKNHTALFAPTGEPVKKVYGTKSVTPSKPPKDERKQPDWNESRTYVYELDNKSLVEEFLLLRECIESGYIGPLSPASFRYTNVREELIDRTDALNYLVEYYKEAVEDYGYYLNGEDEQRFYESDYGFLYNRVLKSRPYHSLLRSSIASFFTLNERSKLNFLEDGVKEYFEAHGGYENAHKVQWTVLKAPK